MTAKIVRGVSCVLMIAAAVLSAAACGSSGASSGSAAQGKSCASNQDCGANALCLSFGGDAHCAPTCSGSADSCGAEAQCGGVGVVAVNACQPKQPASSPQDPPKPAEQPKIPCKTDAECAAAAPGAVCGSWKGERDCTIPCTTDDACTFSMAGLTVRFLHCAADEANASRTICVPRDECLQNPSSCVSLPTTPPTGDAGGLPDDAATPDFDAGF